MTYSGIRPLPPVENGKKAGAVTRRHFLHRHIKNNLEDLGHKIIGEASDGLELVELARETVPDLILTDINMPSLSGIEAIRKINEIQTIPTIIISAYQRLKKYSKFRFYRSIRFEYFLTLLKNTKLK